MSMQYFYLHFNDEDTGGVAYASRSDIDEVAQLEELTEGVIQFSLAEGMLQDYQANNLGWPLMSQSLRRLFDGVDGGPNLSWHTVTVTSPNRTADYFVPMFSGAFDVLDFDRSKIVSGPIGDIVMKACLALEKVRELDFFPLPGSDLRLVISDRIKLNIEAGKLTGIDFSLVPVS